MSIYFNEDQTLSSDQTPMVVKMDRIGPMDYHTGFFDAHSSAAF